MKKIYMLLSVAALYACVLVSMPSQVSAQVNLNGKLSPTPGMHPLAHRYVDNHPVNISRANTGMWLEYWFVEDSLAIQNGTGTPAGFYGFLFPDSSVVACDPSNNCGNPFTHMIGSVLDPNSADMQNVYQYSWSNSNPYTVDSLALIYNYARNTDDGIIDTLIVYLWNNAVASDISTGAYFLNPVAAEYNVDTLHVALMKCDSTGINIPNVSAGALQTFKIPLGPSDTASIGTNSAIKIINTNHFAVPAGTLVASAFTFKPGYSYSPGDVISSIDNDFAFISDSPNGAGTYGPYTKGDWNVSSIVDNTVHYNLSPGGWDGLFIPSYAYNLGYDSQQHLIDYYVTANFAAGINESISSEGTKLYQNQPNPSNHTTLIKYDTQSEGAVTLEVTDLTGRKVMEMNQGNQPSGSHSVTINVSGLSQGMYLYTLRTNSESLTRRMVISE